MKKKRKKGIRRVLAVVLATLLAVAGISAGYQFYKDVTAVKKTELKFVFVHGLSGWGSYDTINKFFPYWGLSGGSVIRYLNQEGYPSYAASVNPTGSAWDRACELYAQLTGSMVDYGEEHSSRCHHERFGKDFSGQPLLEDFADSKIVLLGHSFGGATIRLFSEILANGAASEQEVTAPEDLSPFFAGGGVDRLFAICTLAAPSNGTTAYDLHQDPDFDEDAVEIPEKYLKSGGMVSKGTKAKQDGRIQEDYAAYDMFIDHAMAMNETITTFEHVYYFAYPCSVTSMDAEGRQVPDESITEGIFMKSAILMSQYSGHTAGGKVIDESWQSNDGLVNEISAKTPSGAPGRAYESDDSLIPGIWYEMPVSIGDHMYFQGGLTKRVDIKPFYMELVTRISGLYEN